MREVSGIPIVRKIKSMKELSSCERRRLKQLKEIFRKEGRIPSGTSLQEVRYLLRLEAGRKRYRRRKRPSILEWLEWKEANRRANPYPNLSIEEILGLPAEKKDEQSEVSKK